VIAAPRVAGLALGALLLSAPAARAGELVEATLENGLRVILQEDHRSPVVSLQVWYRVGSRHERVGLTGISHYLEHMMFKGTARYGPRVYSRLLEAEGADDNAFTTEDATAYHVTIAAEKVDLALTLEADRMRNLLLDPREVASELNVILEERRTRAEDDPVGALADELNAVAFKVHPYRLPTIGFVQDIERLTAADLRAWYNTYYHPNNAILVAVGDFQATDLLARVRARFGPIARGDDPPPVLVTEPEQSGERRVVLRRDAQLPVVFVGYPVPNHRSPDTFALEVLSSLLSGGRSSRLHRRLVHADRLALDAGGEYSRLSVDPDLFTVWVTARAGTTAGALEEALEKEVERLQVDLVGEEELTRARNLLEAAFIFGQDSLHARASDLARHELAGGLRLLDGYLPGIRAVTAADIQRVTRRYFTPDHKTTAVLVPAIAPSRAPDR
jgi:zinc protease